MAIDSSVTIELPYRPPFDWEALVSFLGFRAIGGVEVADEGAYRRTLRVDDPAGLTTGWIVARPMPAKDCLLLEVSPSLGKALPRVAERAKRAFDLSSDPRAIADALGELAVRRPGLRLPGSWDGFEVLVRAILGQQVTVQAARTLATRLVDAFGELLPTDPAAANHAGLTHLFPTAACLAAAQPEDIQALGLTGARARALVTAAEAVATGRVSLDPGEDPDVLSEALMELPGVGDWTATYVVMRALSHPDCFPAGDRGILNALGEKTPRQARARAEAWRPWRSYAVMHLWQSLADQQAAPARSRNR